MKDKVSDQKIKLPKVIPESAQKAKDALLKEFETAVKKQSFVTKPAEPIKEVKEIIEMEKPQK